MKKLFLFITLVFSCSFVWAVTVTSLYQAELPIASQSDDLKEQAVQDGFLKVLIKVSGDPQINKNPLIKASLKKADYYVQEYSYSAVTTASSHYTIQIRYDAADVNRLLKKAGVAYWGENRPLILVFLTVSNVQQGTEIIGSDTPSAALVQMKQQSKQYGLPMIFPVMDVTDMNQVTSDDITNMSISSLKEAAKRYAPDALLIGNIAENEEGLQSQWRLVLDKNQWDFTVSGKTTADIVTFLINDVNKTLAQHYVVNITKSAAYWIHLEVMNITERNDLTQLMQYLKQLPIVQQIQLLQVSGDVVELSIQIRGSLDAFEKNASIGAHLVLKYRTITENKLGYVWMR